MSALQQHPALPSLGSVYRTRAGVEVKEFFRQRESVVFTVFFPVVLLLGLGAVLDYDIGYGVTFPQYFMAGVVTAGVVGSSLQNMAIHIAGERSDGTLKGLAGTPMPPSAYFVGKIVQVLAVTVVTVGVLLAVGVLVYGIDLPSGTQWLTFTWVVLLGAAACTLVGIAVSSLARSGRSASAMITPLALMLEFISGVFIQFSQVPTWLQTVASLFPVKWMAQGLRSVFLPAELAAEEPAGTWELGRVALVLGLWCVLGLVLCVRTFRWVDRADR
ncbi:ABC transporter permease subunit [Modestobacter sp. I12A-02628]|uniref:Transport permease protein n=1 Tax=Goekera deserti TaxID=2497753 RepID=A0A7K3WA03_9ACTN|nr:ABC transporter permease [Goekera deserti]MPR00282.1 ABC transporter permease subunit [Goekera deserti]NDI49456.1 ABC transporter permease [Goekera deserti]NEL52670.1 ABC transporter permease [Goekera deserti]